MGYVRIVDCLFYITALYLVCGGNERWIYIKTENYFAI